MDDPPDVHDRPDGGDPGGIDPPRLLAALEASFGGSEGERRAVVRAARDLADDGRLRDDRGESLSVEGIREELAQAPNGGPADRWNWWMGSLEVAYGGYAEFEIRRYRPGNEGNDG